MLEVSLFVCGRLQVILKPQRTGQLIKWNYSCLCRLRFSERTLFRLLLWQRWLLSFGWLYAGDQSPFVSLKSSLGWFVVIVLSSRHGIVVPHLLSDHITGLLGVMHLWDRWINILHLTSQNGTILTDSRHVSGFWSRIEWYVHCGFRHGFTSQRC